MVSRFALIAPMTYTLGRLFWEMSTEALLISPTWM